MCKKCFFFDFVQFMNTNLKHLVNNLRSKGILKYAL